MCCTFCLTAWADTCPVLLILSVMLQEVILLQVGLPAKSGVSGCVLLVIPNAMGICLWSPPLDPLGKTTPCYS